MELRPEIHSIPYPFLYFVFVNLILTWSICIDLGAAYGTAKAGVGIATVGVLKPELVYKSLIPVIMAGILGIYGLIVCVILNGAI